MEFYGDVFVTRYITISGTVLSYNEWSLGMLKNYGL